MADPGVFSHFRLVASDGLSLSLLLSHSCHVSGELMRTLWLAWLVLISSECVHTDGRFPDGYRWSVTFNLSCGYRPTKAAFWKGEMTFKWSICKIPIILLIQCQLALLSSWHTAVLLHRLVLMSAGLVLCHTRLICRTILTKLWALLEALIASVCTMVVYSFKVKSQFSVSCFDIVVAIPK